MRSISTYARIVACIALLLASGMTCCGESWRPPLSTVQVFDPVADAWSAGERMPVALGGARCAVIGGRIYVAGGRDVRDAASPHLLRFDPVARTWEQLADIPTARYGHDVVALGTDLYVVGGMISDTTVEIFDAVRERWTAGPETIEDHSRCGAVEIGGWIYVVGGSTGALEALDPTAGAWQALTPLPVGLDQFAVEADGASMFVMGGWADLGNYQRTERVWIYDPVSDAWSDGPPMPGAGSGTDAATLGNEIYILGHLGDNTRRVFALDLATLTWSMKTPKKGGRDQMGVAASGGLLYAFGGLGPIEER